MDGGGGGADIQDGVSTHEPATDTNNFALALVGDASLDASATGYVEATFGLTASALCAASRGTLRGAEVRLERSRDGLRHGGDVAGSCFR